MNTIEKRQPHVCQNCGKTYDPCNIVNGKLCGYRGKYCSKECRREAKLGFARQRRRDAAKKAEPKVKREANDYRRWTVPPGPSRHATCFDCPFLGWECRSQDYPPCRKSNYEDRCDAVMVEMVSMWLR